MTTSAGAPDALRVLPACDRVTRAERARRRANRWRGRLLCLLARHDWARHRNPEVGGARAHFDLCRRCGTERNEYLPPRYHA